MRPITRLAACMRWLFASVCLMLTTFASGQASTDDAAVRPQPAQQAQASTTIPGASATRPSRAKNRKTASVVVLGDRRKYVDDKPKDVLPLNEAFSSWNNTGDNIFYGAARGDLETFTRGLASLRADLKLNDGDCTVMHYAARGGSTRIMEQLLEMKISVDQPSILLKMTPLYYAAEGV